MLLPHSCCVDGKLQCVEKGQTAYVVVTEKAHK